MHYSWSRLNCILIKLPLKAIGKYNLTLLAAIIQKNNRSNEVDTTKQPLDQCQGAIFGQRRGEFRILFNQYHRLATNYSSISCQLIHIISSR